RPSKRLASTRCSRALSETCTHRFASPAATTRCPMCDVPHWLIYGAPEPTTRICRSCFRTKPVADFCVSKHNRTQCRECKRQDDEAYRRHMRKTDWKPPQTWT